MSYIIYHIYMTNIQIFLKTMKQFIVKINLNGLNLFRAQHATLKPGSNFFVAV